MAAKSKRGRREITPQMNACLVFWQSTNSPPPTPEQAHSWKQSLTSPSAMYGQASLVSGFTGDHLSSFILISTLSAGSLSSMGQGRCPRQLLKKNNVPLFLPLSLSHVSNELLSISPSGQAHFKTSWWSSGYLLGWKTQPVQLQRKWKGVLGQLFQTWTKE